MLTVMRSAESWQWEPHMFERYRERVLRYL